MRLPCHGWGRGVKGGQVQTETLPAPARWSYHRAVRRVLVHLKDDAEGWVPLEVEYHPAGAGRAADGDVKKWHPELASPLRRIAEARGVQLAARLHVEYMPQDR
jgi:hypothetical protein